MSTTLWEKCLECLQAEMIPQQFNTWIRPLHVVVKNECDMELLAPNHFVREWINTHFLSRIQDIVTELSYPKTPIITLNIGSKPSVESATTHSGLLSSAPVDSDFTGHINSTLQFNNFIEGASNQLARAAAFRVGEKPGFFYNPLVFYGGVGLGKTHLMHAIGNMVLSKNPKSKVLYLHSERFVADMIKALQKNTMNQFKKYYRSVNVLLIDDIQFFSGKDRSQEEFFHTFNVLLDAHQQIVVTSDRYPKELSGLEERLKSRFGWGLSIAIEAPDLETRVAILIAKAEQSQIHLPNDVALFMAKHIQSNVRELEGAWKRVVADAHFTGQPISMILVQDALKDLLASQAKLISMEKIQHTISEYYKMHMSDLLSKRKIRSIARPRQVAMYLCKQLTSHSLSEIGGSFSGRDHTTVLHACRAVQSLNQNDWTIQEDIKNLLRILSTG